MTEEISDLKKQRKEELQGKMQKQRKEGMKKAQEKKSRQVKAMKKQLLRKALTKEARERLGRIRAANEEKAEKVEKLVLTLWKSGRIQGKVNDQKLKKLLKEISSREKDINIKRK